MALAVQNATAGSGISYPLRDNGLFEAQPRWQIAALILAATSFFSIPAHAEVINADWKVAGDGLAIVDVTHNMKWLDLTQTANMTTDEVGSQFGIGELFEGWRFATAADVTAMLTSAGATHLNNWNVGNVPAVEYLFDVWGELGISPGRGTRSSYFAVDPPSTFYRGGALAIGNQSWQPGQGWAGPSNVVDVNHNYRESYAGVALVQPVPEPSSLALAGAGILGMLFCHGRRKVRANLRRSVTSLLLLVLPCCALGHVEAAPITVFTNESAFLATADIVSTEMFAYPANTVFGTGTAVIDGVKYVAGDPTAVWRTIGIFVHPSPPNALTSGDANLDGKRNTLTFPNGGWTEAIGFYFCKGQSTPAFPAFTITATALDGAQYVENIMSNVEFNTFRGFIAPQGIVSVSILDIPGNGHGSNWDLDNVSHGVIVPEPATSFLLGIGATSLLAYVRGRRKDMA